MHGNVVYWRPAICNSKYDTSLLDPNLPSFDGYCRYGSDEFDTIRILYTYSASDCYYACFIRDTCASFAYYDISPGQECHLYRNGPYTNGSSDPNTKCYIKISGTLLLLQSLTHYNQEIILKDFRNL